MRMYGVQAEKNALPLNTEHKVRMGVFNFRWQST